MMHVGENRRRRDERGGSVSFWVVMMTPILLYAGILARAGPQRIAAESTMQDTAEDLATIVAIRRHTEDTPQGELGAFPFDCATRDQRLSDSCNEMEIMFTRDLADVGVDTRSLRGFYSDALSESRADQELVSPFPCSVRIGTDEQRLFVDGAQVAVVGDWRYGWAASQIWPSGIRVSGDATAHLTGIAPSLAGPCDHPDPDVGDLLDPSTKRGRDVLQNVDHRTLINAD